MTLPRRTHAGSPPAAAQMTTEKTQELRDGRAYELPDGRSGRVGRCRLCGAEVVFAYALRYRRTIGYDVDGERHAISCAERADEPAAYR